MRKVAATGFERWDFALRVATFVALVVGGFWGLWQYRLSGAQDWTTNITIETKVLPYRDDLRLLVIDVRSKNPRTVEIELVPKLGDSYKLRLRKLATDKKANTVFDEDSGELLADIDLLADVGESYVYLPGAEMQDERSVVLPAGTVALITAEMKIHNGDMTKDRKPDADFIPASTVVRIEP